VRATLWKTNQRLRLDIDQLRQERRDRLDMLVRVTDCLSRDGAERAEIEVIARQQITATREQIESEYPTS
jgi:hypothetical protein